MNVFVLDNFNFISSKMCLSVCLSIYYLFVCLFLYLLSVCLSVCLSLKILANNIFVHKQTLFFFYLERDNHYINKDIYVKKNVPLTISKFVIFLVYPIIQRSKSIGEALYVSLGGFRLFFVPLHPIFMARNLV